MDDALADLNARCRDDAAAAAAQ